MTFEQGKQLCTDQPLIQDLTFFMHGSWALSSLPAPGWRMEAKVLYYRHATMRVRTVSTTESFNFQLTGYMVTFFL